MVSGRSLVRTFSAFGLVLGLAGAALWHWARLEVGGFTVFAGPESEPFKIPTHHPGWWPSALIFAVAGLLIGMAAGLTLTRLGWAMVRVGGKNT